MSKNKKRAQRKMQSQVDWLTSSEAIHQVTHCQGKVKFFFFSSSARKGHGSQGGNAN